MAIQTLNTIKQWFRTGLKPTQTQFWDTWDSFRHKSEKVPVKDIEGISELLAQAIPEIPNINGNPNRLTKIEQDAKGKLNLTESNITDTGDKININSITEIDSQINGESGLKFRQLKNESKTISEIIFDQDVIPTAGIDGTAYFAYGKTVKKVNLDKTVTDYYLFPEGCFIESKIIVSPNNGDLFLIYFDGVSSYILVKLDQSGILSVLRSSILSYRYLTVDKNDNIYVQEIGSQKIFRINTVNLNDTEYYTGNLTLSVLGFDLESNGYFYDYQNRNLVYKLGPEGRAANFTTLDFEIGTGCVKPDGSLYVTSYDENDKNIYSVDRLGNNVKVFASLPYKSFEPYVAENGYLYVHNNDYDNGLVYKISPTGTVRLFGSAGNSPRYMAVTNSGIVYISNSASYNLIKIANHDVENLLTLDENGNVLLSDKEFTAKSDFKTINGESIVGSGNIILGKGSFITVTRTELENLVGNGDIIAGGTYKVLNADNWANIYLTGITPNMVSKEGLGEFKIPKYGNYSYYPWTINMEGALNNIVGNFQKNEPVVANNGATGSFLIPGLIKYESGDWSGATSITGSYSNATGDASFFTSPDYSEGIILSWGGNHWRNLTGNIGEPLDEITLNSDWELYQDNMLTEYDVIEYNYQNDYISFRKDKRGNELSTKERYLANKHFNPLKVFRWGDDDVYGNKFTNSYIEICNERFWKVTNNIGINWTIQGNVGSGWHIVSNTGEGTNISDNIGLSNQIQGNKLQYCYIQRNCGSSNTLSYNDFNVGTISDNFSDSGLRINGNNGVGWNIQYNNFKGNLGSGIENNRGNYWRIEYITGDYWNISGNIGTYWRFSNITGRSWNINSNTGNSWNISNNEGSNWSFGGNSGNIFALTNQSYSNKNFSLNNFTGIQLYMNLSSATVIFQPFTKYFNTKPDGTMMIAHYDNSNNLVTNNLTD